MIEILGKIFTPSLVYATFRSSTVIIYAGLCAAVTMQAGILNIGTEGIMLMGAFVGAVVSIWTENWFIAILAAMAGGVVIAMILAVGNIRYKASMPAIGTGMNMLIVALTRFLLQIFFDTSGSLTSDKMSKIPTVTLPFLGKHELLNTLFNNWCLTEWFVLLLVLLLWYFFYKTPYGLRLRAVGKHPVAAQSAGIKPDQVKYLAMAFGGAIGGLAGAHLSLGYTSMFIQNMTNNRGFIGVAAMWFGDGNPVTTALGCLIFGFTDSVGARLQAYGYPAQLVLALPYLMVFVVLTVLMAMKVSKENKKKSSLALESQ